MFSPSNKTVRLEEKFVKTASFIFGLRLLIKKVDRKIPSQAESFKSTTQNGQSVSLSFCSWDLCEFI